MFEIKKFLNKNFYPIIYFISIFIGLNLILWVHTQPVSDFKYYYELAEGIGNGNSFGNTYTSIGYSIILGYIFKLTGSSLIIAKVFNLFLFSLIGILIYLIIKKMHISERKRKILYFVFMFFPTNLEYINLVSSELLFTFLLMLLIYTYLFINLRYSWVICGAIIGLETIIKPFFIIFPMVVFVYNVITKKQFKKPVIELLVTVILVSCVISPLIYRNTIYNGEFTFVSNNGGIVLYINNNSQNRYGRWMDAQDVADSAVNKEFYVDATMTEKNKILSQEAKKWIKSHPLQFMVLGVKRLINTYFVCDDMFFVFEGTKFWVAYNGLNQYFLNIKNNFNIYAFVNLISNIFSAILKLIIFLPSILLIGKVTRKYFVKIIKGEILDNNSVMFLGIFYMFTIIYFITEGQGRYSYPLNFILIYYSLEFFFKDDKFKYSEKKIINK